MVAWSIAGKHVVITGATAGIGLATAYELARRGAKLTLIGRNPVRGADVIEQIRRQTPGAQIDFLEADLASLESVKAVCQSYLDRIIWRTC
jgi:retinol dehydrogenase 12